MKRILTLRAAYAERRTVAPTQDSRRGIVVLVLVLVCVVIMAVQS